ncbi:MAG: hypothetical protein CVV50_03390, partial [Spirochaetae bacterium HGW-Spirochaetae-6]
LWLTPWFLLFTGVLMINQLKTHYPKKIIFWLVFVYLNTLAAEIIGVATGKVFGVYSYGPTLGPQVLGVPWIIGLNWSLILAGGLALSTRLTPNRYLQILLTGFFAVAIDFFIEPVAIRLDYWHWANSVIPLQNYLAWFILAIFNTSVFQILKISFQSRLFISFYGIQFAFFLILNIFFRIVD